MKIKIDDGMQVAHGTGIGKYTRHLADALEGLGNTPVLECYAPQGRQIVRRLRYLLHINSPAYRRASGEYDIAHYTNFLLPIFRNKQVKYVSTVHDLTALLHPDTLPPAFRAYGKWMVRHAVKHADLYPRDLSLLLQNAVPRKGVADGGKIGTERVVSQRNTVKRRQGLGGREAQQHRARRRNIGG